IIPVPSGSAFVNGVAFHPTLPRLAAAGTLDLPKPEEGESDSAILIWELEPDRLVGAPLPRSVSYATAKVVLVGDSGVGKTGLGWRVAHGEFREHPSTHGQQFWVVEQLRSTRVD